MKQLRESAVREMKKRSFSLANNSKFYPTLQCLVKILNKDKLDPTLPKVVQILVIIIYLKTITFCKGPKCFAKLHVNKGAERNESFGPEIRIY